MSNPVVVVVVDESQLMPTPTRAELRAHPLEVVNNYKNPDQPAERP
jgi:hypothetical protein